MSRIGVAFTVLANKNGRKYTCKDVLQKLKKPNSTLFRRIEMEVEALFLLNSSSLSSPRASSQQPQQQSNDETPRVNNTSLSNGITATQQEQQTVTKQETSPPRKKDEHEENNGKLRFTTDRAMLRFVITMETNRKQNKENDDEIIIEKAELLLYNLLIKFVKEMQKMNTKTKKEFNDNDDLITKLAYVELPPSNLPSGTTTISLVMSTSSQLVMDTILMEFPCLLKEHKHSIYLGTIEEHATTVSLANVGIVCEGFLYHEQAREETEESSLYHNLQQHVLNNEKTTSDSKVVLWYGKNVQLLLPDSITAGRHLFDTQEMDNGKERNKFSFIPCILSPTLAIEPKEQQTTKSTSKHQQSLAARTHQRTIQNRRSQMRNSRPFCYYGGMAPKNVVRVIVHLSLMEIQEGAFANCEQLQSIVIMEGSSSMNNNDSDSAHGSLVSYNSSVLTKIRKRAFHGCISLEHMQIPSSIKDIGKMAFTKCASLESITFDEPSGITKLKPSIFSECTSLVKIEIPSSVIDIEQGAFSDCTCLKYVTIPSSVQSIGYGAFLGCSSLSTITIPASVTSIGENAFLSCQALQSVLIESNDTKIGKFAFSLCTSLQSKPIGYFDYTGRGLE